MVLCSALSHYFSGEKAERRKNLQAGVAGWLADRKCKPGYTQIRMILNRNITNISNPYSYFFVIVYYSQQMHN
jgi:hypothetical protein